MDENRLGWMECRWVGREQTGRDGMWMDRAVWNGAV